MSRTSGRLALATLLGASSLTVMAGATIAPALPAMRAHFHNVDHVGLLVRLVLTLPALVIAIAAPAAGFAVDRFGRRRLLTFAIVLYAFAGASGLVLDSITGILAGRVALGIAVAIIMTAATALIADIFRGPERARVMGLQAGSMAFGGVVFLLLGGVLADVSWRGPFAVYLAALLVVPAILLLEEPAREPDPPHDGTAPPMPRTLLALLCGIAFIGMLAFYMVPTQGPFLVERRAGAGGLATGAALATATLTAAFMSFAYGRVRARVGHVGISSAIFTLLGIGYVILGLATSYLTLIAGFATTGVGMGMLMPNLNVWLSTAVPPRLRGRALGALTTAVFIGQFASPLASQPVVDAADLHTLFVGAGIALVLAALALPAVARLTIGREATRA